MPPLPDPDSTRSDRAPTTFLPAGGFRGSFPDPPGSLPEDLVAEYVGLWRSPMAAAWTSEEGPLVVQYVTLRRLVADKLSAGEFPPGTALSRMTSLEDRFLMSPKARAAAHVRFVDAAVDVDVDDGDYWSKRWSDLPEQEEK